MFKSNFRLNQRVTLTEGGFSCDDIPAVVAQEELKWGRRSEPLLTRRVRELQRKLEVHHDAVMKAYRMVPKLFNQLRVAEDLLAAHPDHEALRDAAALTNAVSRERDRLVHMDTAQILLDARRARGVRPARGAVEESDAGEELGPEGGSADDADAMEDDQDEMKEAQGISSREFHER